MASLAPTVDSSGDVSLSLGGRGYEAQPLGAHFRELMVLDGYAPADAVALAAAARRAMGTPLDRPLARALSDAELTDVCPSSEVFCGGVGPTASAKPAGFSRMLEAVRAFGTACDRAFAGGVGRAATAGNCAFDGTLPFVPGEALPMHPLHSKDGIGGAAWASLRGLFPKEGSEKRPTASTVAVWLSLRATPSRAEQVLLDFRGSVRRAKLVLAPYGPDG